MADDSPAGQVSYYASLGAATVAWNQAENSLRQMLIALCGASPEIWILTAELSAIPLERALQSGATDIASARLKPFIEHCIEWFDRLREYRNYYIHGINDVSLHYSGKFVGDASQTTAKRRLVIHQEFIFEERLLHFRQQAAELLAFSSDVLFHVAAHPMTAFSDGKPFPPLPEMPPLPDRLQKPRQNFTTDPSTQEE